MNCGERKHIRDRNELHMAHALCQCERVSDHPRHPSPECCNIIISDHNSYGNIFTRLPQTAHTIRKVFYVLAMNSAVVLFIFRLRCTQDRCGRTSAVPSLSGAVKQTISFSQSTVCHVHARTYILCEFFINILSLQRPKYLLRGKEKYEVKNESR